MTPIIYFAHESAAGAGLRGVSLFLPHVAPAGVAGRLEAGIDLVADELG